MQFGKALELLRNGRLISREGWNGKGMFLYCVHAQYVNDHLTNKSVFLRAYIAMHTAQGDRVPWVASQTDILAGDWQEVEIKSIVEPVNSLYGEVIGDGAGNVQAQCGQAASAGYNKSNR